MEVVNIQQLKDASRQEIIDFFSEIYHPFSADEVKKTFSFVPKEFDGEADKFISKIYGNASKIKLIFALSPEILLELFELDEDFVNIVSMLDLGAYIKAHPCFEPITLSNKFQVATYMGERIKKYKQEELVLLGIDEENHIVDKKTIHGDYKEVKIAENAIRSFVKDSPIKKVIMVHNHPSGIYEPSTSDIVQTIFVSKMLAGKKIRVVEHLIICEDGTFSFRDNGILDAINYFINNEINYFSEKYDEMDSKLFIAIMTSKLGEYELTGEEKMIVSACFLAYKLYKKIDTREKMLW